MMDTQRLIALIVFSFSGLLLWEAWQKHEAPPAVTSPAAMHAPASTSVPGSPTATTATPQPSSASPIPASGAPVAAAGAPVKVSTDLFDIDINTTGGDIRRLTLRKVYSAQDRTKPLTLMEPDPEHYFGTQSGLLGDDLPTHKSTYTAEQPSYALADGADSLDVTLHAREPNGTEVTKTYRFHRGSYKVDVGYQIVNHGDKPITPFAYFQFIRDSNAPSPQAAQTARFAGVSTFTGPAIYTEESKFHKVTFKDIDNRKQTHPTKATDGWVAIVQHYFVSAWLPKQGVQREFFTKKVSDTLYAAGVVVPVGTIAPGATGGVDMPAYIGPQEKDRLEAAAPGLNLVVDYGWLYIIAAPIFWLMKEIHGFVGNWGWSIILLTILIKLAFYPLNAKAGRSMAQMKVLGPKMQKLKELYGDDRQKLNTAMMELYRTEKINPLGGCLPIVVQIPVFISLYWVLLASIELRHAPWLGWIHDLSAPDPYFVLPILYAISMFAQTRINPQPADPVQAKVMMVMPVMFSVFFLFFPAGLVLYWVVQNLLSILQQWHINRTIAAEAKAKARR